MKTNKIREMLNAGLPTTSTRLWSTNPFFTEAVGVNGCFDYCEFVAEYAPYTQIDLQNIARAAELHNMGTMIKLDFANRWYTAQKAIASGFQSIMFTDHRTAAEVEETLRYIRPETPEDGGLFGFPNNRFIGMRPYVDQMDHAARLRDTVVCLMIEKKEAVENIEEICSVEGVDMIQFGPSDYSLSSGFNRSAHSEEVREVERKVIACALRHNLAARCEINSADDAQYYADLGVRHFSVGDQYRIMRSFYEKEGKKIRDVTENLK